MSADSHAPCPSCYPQLLEESNILVNLGDDLGLPTELRENVEYYLENATDGLQLVFSYYVDCWVCGLHFETTMREPVKL